LIRVLKARQREILFRTMVGCYMPDREVETVGGLIHGLEARATRYGPARGWRG